MQENHTDIEFEIKFYEGILKNRAGFIEALVVLGDLYTKQGAYAKGLSIDEKLAQLKPGDPIVFYNLACSYSLLGQIDQAFVTIQKAISCGYDDFDYLKQDADLLNLLQDERFKKFLAQQKGEAQVNENLHL